MSNLLTADEVRRMLRQLIEERYESQKQAARVWHMPSQNLNDMLQGRRALPDTLVAKLGLEAVTMYRKT
jgi:plasmid maintenance system antidote protein VapI